MPHHRPRRRYNRTQHADKKNKDYKRREKRNSRNTPLFTERMTKSRIFLFLGSICTIFCLTLSACNRHPKAEALYLRAEEAFGTGEYHTAQRIIDSIPESDTLAFEWIRKGIILNQRITLEQNRRNLSFIDSLLPLPVFHKRRTPAPIPLYTKQRLSR